VDHEVHGQLHGLPGGHVTHPDDSAGESGKDRLGCGNRGGVAPGHHEERAGLDRWDAA